MRAHRYYCSVKQNNNNKGSLSYRAAGVDIDAANALIARIKSFSANTRRPGVMGDLGGFGALFDLSSLGYRQPVLVAGADGVGTKIKLAIDANRHDSIGADLVAMCVNDVVVQGAEPLFFLDYFACSRLNIAVAESVIRGISRACEFSACGLVGGETAEMPGLYAEGDYDLAGFCVGVVEKDHIIDGGTVSVGDSLIALASSGCHANGYTLIRKILADSGTSDDFQIDGKAVIDHLLEPTRIYAPAILRLLKQTEVKSMAHITGGGLVENIPRTIPESKAARINVSSWKMPMIFEWLMETGTIAPEEMYRIFNCGVGMVLCVAGQDEANVLSVLDGMGEIAWKLGEIIQRSDGQDRIVLHH